jgi:sarcosine oxidase subunit beta
MKSIAEAVVIGGGVHGCSVAYNLAKKGMKDVVLLEKDYLASGATGRCAAGIRRQFGTEINCLLMKEGMEILENLNEELGWEGDLEITHGGYIWLAYNDSQAEQLIENVKLQNSLGITDSVFLGPEEIKEIAPLFNTDGVVGGSFNPKDGHANPFHIVFAYANAAKKLGVEVNTHTEATDIKIMSSGRFKVTTNKGAIETPIIVVCAGAYGKKLGAMVGLDIPVYPERHQIFVTEPIEYFLPCMFLSSQHGTYFKQNPNGTILMGVGDPENEPKEFNMDTSWPFIEDAVKKFVFHMPSIKNVRIMRHWAGLYDMTPDSQAIIGSTPVEGFYLDLGWSGHGFQMGPVVGRLLTEIITEGKCHLPQLEMLNLRRYETGELVYEPACV